MQFCSGSLCLFETRSARERPLPWYFEWLMAGDSGGEIVRIFFLWVSTQFFENFESMTCAPSIWSHLRKNPKNHQKMSRMIWEPPKFVTFDVGCRSKVFEDLKNISCAPSIWSSLRENPTKLEKMPRRIWGNYFWWLFWMWPPLFANVTNTICAHSIWSPLRKNPKNPLIMSVPNRVRSCLCPFLLVSHPARVPVWSADGECVSACLSENRVLIENW